MRSAVLLALLALGACATPAPPERVFPVFFPQDSVGLDPAAMAVIARAASVSQRFPGRLVHVIGYADTDAVPSVAKLSSDRAATVSAQLQADGVPAAVIQRASGGSPANSQPGVERRRVEIDIDTP